MRIALSTLLVALVCFSQAEAKSRKWLYGAQENQGVSLEMVDRYTVRLTVMRPNYQIPTVEIKLSDPIAYDRPDCLRFAGGTPYANGTLNIRGRWFTNGTVSENDDRVFINWVYRGSGFGEAPPNPCDVDDEILEGGE